MTAIAVDKRVASGDRTSKLESSLVALVRERAKLPLAGASAVKAAAFSKLLERGLPSRKDEAFRFSALGPLAERTVFDGSSREPIGSPAMSAGERQSVLLQVSNDRTVAPAGLPKGLEIVCLRDALSTDDNEGLRRLGTLLSDQDGFIAANTAGFGDGYLIKVEDGITLELPLELCFGHGGERVATDGEALMSFPRVLLWLGRGSRLSVIERHEVQGSGASVSSGVMEVFIGDGAELEHSRWVDLGSQHVQLAATAVSVGLGGTYRSWSATAAGGLVRHDLQVRLAGRRASTVLDGLYYGRRGQLADHHVRVWHEQPEGSTKESYRGVVEDLGKGVFDGIIYVRSGAMKTDARQENRNLLLGPQAVVNTKPHLEIDADDVACSHGATVGQLDENQLFYLQARGIDLDLGRQMLTWAFAKEMVERCPASGLRRRAAERLRGGLPDQLESLALGDQT
jgi:Fe-S cluster assembly protein SufD